MRTVIAAQAAAMTAQARQELSQQGQESETADTPPQAYNADSAQVSSTELTSTQPNENKRNLPMHRPRGNAVARRTQEEHDQYESAQEQHSALVKM